ncbi:hypothetical protein [Cyclobacterium plantarum]|uniref:Outer membrane protein beta-barrel domain-containing protein n=1 Tax=Cyclobacterium plantarum TaxID=2716263 RepID=A0ABX0H516_9BACT|nr:hypothetical protein [Cyclobacterium plantarum]NHE56940.1 hypothetical protein [Cyclobacterium plantarum]
MKNLLKFYLFLTAFLLAVNCVKAQDATIPKKEANFDLALGMGENSSFSYALSWNQSHGMFSSNKFRLGYGLRFSGFTGSELNYITAPADLTGDEATIDTLLISNPHTLGLSALINLQYQLSSKFKIGFNIDAIGLGFGSTSDGRFISSENTGQYPEMVKASPSSFNLLLVGDRDLGQLKSEFYVAYALSEKTWLRGGMDMTFTEYTTNQELTNANDRFRYKPVLVFLAVSYNPFN